jgi:hypothetical protein
VASSSFPARNDLIPSPQSIDGLTNHSIDTHDDIDDDLTTIDTIQPFHRALWNFIYAFSRLTALVFHSAALIHSLRPSCVVSKFLADTAQSNSSAPFVMASNQL